MISVSNLSYYIGGRALYENASMFIKPKDKIGLIGLNGRGKSTLLKLISGELSPDAGEVIRAKGIRIAHLPQEVPRRMPGRVVDLVTASGGNAPSPPPHQVDTVLSQFGLDPEAPFENLSAGLKRQVLLARALVVQPDLLLLDEPTNHLDITTICRLETELLRRRFALVLVTHDRTFLQRLSTAIVDIDMARAVRWDCDYVTYLARKEASLQAEAAQSARFDKLLRG